MIVMEKQLHSNGLNERQRETSVFLMSKSESQIKMVSYITRSLSKRGLCAFKGLFDLESY